MRDLAHGQAAFHRLDGHRDPGLENETSRKERKPSTKQRLNDLLNKPREKLEIEDDCEKENDLELEQDRDIVREVDRDRSLSH
ncbi:MAG: hypothetical protein ABJV27_19630 [Roseibium sp.]